MDPIIMPLEGLPTEQSFLIPSFFTQFMIGIVLFLLFLAIFMIIASCKVYMKAGRKWWEAIIPIYNTFIYFRIINLSWWWLLVFLPILGLSFYESTEVMGMLLNFGFSIFLTERLSKSFGQGGWFTVGLVLLPFIFFPILAWGKSEYKGINKFV